MSQTKSMEKGEYFDTTDASLKLSADEYIYIISHYSSASNNYAIIACWMSIMWREGSSLITELSTRDIPEHECDAVNAERDAPRLALITCTIPSAYGIQLMSKWDGPVKQQARTNLICGQFLVELYIAVMPDEPVQWIILSYDIYIHHLYGIRLTLTYNAFIVTSATGRMHDTKFWQRDTWHQTKGICSSKASRRRGETVRRA